MRWVVIGIVVVVAVLFFLRLLLTPRRPRPEHSVGRSIRVYTTPTDDPADRSRDE